ncbi:MAG TPA: PfaD family polyunsaturated fatty acid/polyketide biosynthesis protein [Anaerolineae bacterium]|nr:PfaD family polyunsaturated fatty acid/polyketide biosynthesis protein [Anaerolineae bacterium]
MQRTSSVVGVQHRIGPEKGDQAILAALLQVSRPIDVVDVDGELAVSYARPVPGFDGDSRRAFAPALLPQDLGDPAFKQAHHLRYAYVAGAMAQGISSVALVEALARAGMLGFFGAAGLPLGEIEKAIVHLQRRLGALPFGFNLMHTASEPECEAALVELYLRHGVHRVDASAFVDLTLPLVLYRVTGIHREPDGRIVCPNHILAKVSRVEVARRFLAPPPESMLRALLANNRITYEEAQLARFVPVAQDLLAEADSGGHTDNRPALVLLPTLLALCDELNAAYQYAEPVRVGLGGGLATPAAVAAAFSLGAACVLTGSVNQACLEAGTSEVVREMLAAARPVDVGMAPSADMFERGVQVQVLKRGSAFASRARKLYELYCQYDSLESIPQDQRRILEQDFFRHTLEEEWDRTQDFFNKRDRRQIQRAETDPKHKLALILRSYLGQASRWAISGDPARKMDYLIWCGPAMGAFNEWAKGSFLEKIENRRVTSVALNLLLGAAVVIRAGWLRLQGVQLPIGAGGYRPMTVDAIHQLCELASSH